MYIQVKDLPCIIVWKTTDAAEWIFGSAASQDSKISIFFSSDYIKKYSVYELFKTVSVVNYLAFLSEYFSESVLHS